MLRNLSRRKLEVKFILDDAFLDNVEGGPEEGKSMHHKDKKTRKRKGEKKTRKN